MAGGFLRFSHLGITLQQQKKRHSANEINAAIQDALERIWIAAGAVFVKELAKSVLVETGESFGSLIPLAGRVGVTLNLPSVKGRKRPQLVVATGQPIEGTRRSLGTGINRGQGAFDFEFGKGRFSFTFSIPVFQFALHDAGAGASGPSSGPSVNAAARAQAAASRFARESFRELVGPMIGTWLTTGRVETITL